MKLFSSILSPFKDFIARKTGLRTKFIGMLTSVLLILCLVFLGFTYFDQTSKEDADLLERSRILVEEMNAVWDFASINQDTINYSEDGEFEYKGLHCAIVGKTVGVLFSENSDYSISFTNSNPRNIYNEPDSYEQEALNAFLEDSELTEYYGRDTVDGESVFRYVAAMEVTEECLDCHGSPEGELDVTGYPREGWELGDLAGAISVVVPTDDSDQDVLTSIASYVVFFAALVLCMVIVVYVAFSRLVIDPLENMQSSFERVGNKATPSIEGPVPALEEVNSQLFSSREIDQLFERFNQMAQKLADLYESLESQVAERTSQLSLANKALQEQREYVEQVNVRLESDNRYKSDFLAIVSHELRTPLTSILAFTELMMDNIDSEDAETLKQLEEVQKNGFILLEMVENMLEIARIQAGNESVHLELVDLNDVVGMVDASNRAVAVKKGVTFTTVVMKDVPLIMSDWEKVRRILVNLVSNAVKFTPSQGCVEVVVSYVSEEEFVRIVVRDTGIGIPSDKLTLIFERFTQENMSTVRRFGGSGLGLSLVKDLSQMLGGSVEVVSEVGKGSTFIVQLPEAAQDRILKDESLND